MALEDHAEHVVALALHPVGAPVQVGERGASRLASRQPRTHDDDQARLEILDAAHDLEPLIFPVDGREPVEVATAEVVPDETAEVLPALARNADGESCVGNRVQPEPLLDEYAQIGRAHV